MSKKFDMDHEECLFQVRSTLMTVYEAVGNDETKALVVLLVTSKIVQEAFSRIDGYAEKIAELDAIIEHYAREFLDYGEEAIGTINQWHKKHGGE